MKTTDDVFALIGACLGGTVGYFAFFWLIDQNLYGLVVPGGLLGLGAGLFRPRSILVPVICGGLALALGLFTEWRYAPFQQDAGLGYFLTHAYQLKPATLIMILVGTLLGFWIPFRRGQDAKPH